MKGGIKKILGFLIAGIVALFLLYDHATLFGDSNEDSDQIDGVVVERSSDAIRCVKFDFSDNYQYIDVDIVFSDSLSRTMFIYDIFVDSITVSEKMKRNDGYEERKLLPILVKSEEVYNHDFDNIHSMVVVDLSLPQELVDTQRDLVIKLDRVTNNDNLHVVFSGGGELSNQYLVSKYVLDNNFVSKGEQNYLLRDIVEVNDRMQNDSKHYLGMKSWAEIPNSKKVMFVLSDGDLYSGGVPIDPDHYELQQELYELGIKAAAEDKSDDNAQFPIHYINFNKSDSLSQDLLYQATKMRLQSLCSMTGGHYFDNYVYEDLFEPISERVENLERIEYRLRFENPFGKIYLGESNELILDFYVDGKSYVHSTFNYSIGLWVDPIIIGMKPDWVVVSIGLLYLLLAIATIYIILQVIYPYIRFLIFKRRYIITFSDKPMVYNETIVGEECHFCRDRFKAGDRVVVKCRHTTHLDCWEENGYKCTEYGDKCTEGSFYYNRYNIFDKNNAPYQMWWVVGSLIVAFIVWSSFVLLNVSDQNIICRVVDSLFNSTIVLVNESDFLDVHLYYEAASTRYLYIYGFLLCFWLSLFLGMMSSGGQPLFRRIVSRLLLALGCGLSGMFVFFIYGIITTPIDVPNDGIFVITLLMLLLSLSLSIFSSLGTKVGWLRVVKGVGLTLFIAMVLVLLVDLPERKGLFSEYIQLLFNCAYCVGFAITFCHVVPASRRYFLRVSGAVKSTEIAIFKWFSSAKNYDHVNIGRSRDCEIHLDWDLSAEISATHATIESRRYGLYVVAHEEMLFNGSKCVVGRRYRLYDMSSFQIGKSTFTYVEKDQRR
ncbi:MAG: FHA domain-containing protein [Rikenellaceae bacterium]